MKSLIRNYINLLTVDKLKEFGIKNDIYLNEEELNFLLDLVKNNYKEIIKDDEKYLKLIESNINKQDFIKIKNLYIYYKDRYKGYLF